MKQETKARFVSASGSLWAIREAVCAKAREAAPRVDCVIEIKEYFYPGELDKALRNQACMNEAFAPIRQFATGVHEGKARCALLIDMETHEGVIVNYNDRWRCSYWPIISRRRAIVEWTTRIRLIALAEEMRGQPLMIKKPIQPGRADWCELLMQLLERERAGAHE